MPIDFEDENEEEEDEIIEDSRKLANPECYLETNTGDLFIIWWKQNRPVNVAGRTWVQISRKCFDTLSRGR